MQTLPVPASAAEAVGRVLSGLKYLASIDPTTLAAQVQAECLQAFEQADAMSTAGRARILAAFTAGQGYSADADYSPAAWLIHRTKVTRGAARGHLGWARRTVTHPQVLAALAEGTVVSASIARVICGWTDKLPQDCQADADEILLGAAGEGLGIEDLAVLAAEIYARSLSAGEDDPEARFEDRQVRIETTFQGAGVLTGDLTPECAAIVTTVLESLSAPAGAEDTRTREQRFHDGLQEAMRRLAASGLLPERAGQPVKVWAHISLAELRALDDGSVLETQWVTEMRIRWSARRAQASGGAGGDGGAWLDGDAARAMACDAAIAPIVTGDINPGVLDDLVALCLQLAGHGLGCHSQPGANPAIQSDPATSPEPGTQSGPADSGDHADQSDPASPRPAWRCCPGCRGRRSGRRSSARPPTCYPAPAASPRSCAPGSWGPGWPGRACRWISATPRPSRPGSATRSSCATSGAAGPAAATSPPKPAKSTTSGTRRTAAPPAPRTASCCAGSTTRSSSTAGAGPWS